MDRKGLILNVRNLNKNDTGNYRCEIHNDADTGKSETYSLNVHCKFISSNFFLKNTTDNILSSHSSIYMYLKQSVLR